MLRLEGLSPVRGALLVSALAAALLLPPLGARVIASSDEARFALLARDIVTRGAWLDARVRGEVYRNKPPLLPWAIAALSRPAGGVSAATARAPVAAAAIATVAITFLLGHALHGARVGLWAALIVLTSYGFFEHAERVLPDMLVALFATCALRGLWLAAARGRPPRAFYAWTALAVFAKGPMGLLPLAVAVAWLAAEAGAKGVRRLWSPGGAVIFVALTLVWLVPSLRLGSGTYVQGVVRQDWLAWYVGLSSPKALEHLVVGLLPWTLLLPLALGAVARAPLTPALRLELAALAVPLALVLSSRNQLARYLLPCYPWAALLIAWWLDRLAGAPSRAARALGLAAAAAALALVPALVVARPSARHWVPVLAPALAPAAAGVLVAGAALGAGLIRARARLAIYGGAAGMALALGWGVWPYSAWTNATYDYPRLAAAINRQAGTSAAAVYATNMTLQIDFYAGHDLPALRSPTDVRRVLASPGHPIVAIDSPTWRASGEDLKRQVTALARVPIAGDDFTLFTRR
ncbi:MAG: glycosyltransferase family 39 protein [Candidatus Rokubacteria bacterium]|nr:glycosyltransferase family 39 protein [Candidatus Rokubacteria bacterium]